MILGEAESDGGQGRFECQPLPIETEMGEALQGLVDGQVRPTVVPVEDNTDDGAVKALGGTPLAQQELLQLLLHNRH